MSKGTYYIFYNTVTGAIEQCRKLREEQAHRNCAVNENMHCMPGHVLDINRWRVDLDTLEIVACTSRCIDPNKYALCRERRNGLLIASDWTQAVDAPISDAKKAEWATYRQQLRDLLSNIDDVEYADIVWPTPPA